MLRRLSSISIYVILCLCGVIHCQTRMIINKALNISINQSTCDSQSLNGIGSMLKCLKLCQETKCKNLIYNTNNCTIVDGSPSLIEILSLPDMEINYILNRKLLYGERCHFAPDKCSEDGQLRCINGTCNCYEDPQSFGTGLIYNWPFCFGYTDTISGLNLTNYNTRYQPINNQDNTKFLLINDGYLQAPEGLYFNINFTISLWVYINSIRKFSKAIDFGNGPDNNNIAITLSSSYSGVPYYEILRSSLKKSITSHQTIPLHQWIHIAVTQSDDFSSFYINGTLKASSIMHKINLMIRTRNFIGKSNWNDELVNAYYRKLRIYNRSLLINEIRELWNNF